MDRKVSYTVDGSWILYNCTICTCGLVVTGVIMGASLLESHAGKLSSITARSKAGHHTSSIWERRRGVIAGGHLGSGCWSLRDDAWALNYKCSRRCPIFGGRLLRKRRWLWNEVDATEWAGWHGQLERGIVAWVRGNILTVVNFLPLQMPPVLSLVGACWREAEERSWWDMSWIFLDVWQREIWIINANLLDLPQDLFVGW